MISLCRAPLALLFGQTTPLVFLAAAAGAWIISADLGQSGLLASWGSYFALRAAGLPSRASDSLVAGSPQGKQRKKHLRTHDHGLYSVQSASKMQVSRFAGVPRYHPLEPLPREVPPIPAKTAVGDHLRPTCLGKRRPASRPAVARRASGVLSS